MNENWSHSDELLEIKAEIFKVIRAAPDGRSARLVMRDVKEHLKGIDSNLISKAMIDLAGHLE